MEKYFDCPKQVMFADPDNVGGWIVGIAYKDEIICACCGGVFNIDDVIEQATAHGVKQAIYPYEDWIDVAVEITGGEMPKGLSIDGEKISEIDYDEAVLQDEEVSEYEAHYFRDLEDAK